MADLTVVVAIEEGTPVLHLQACLLFTGIEEVALTPDPVHTHAQGPIPPIVVTLGLGHVHAHAQDPIPLVDVAVGHDLDQDPGLVRMSVEGELLGGGGDRLRGR